VPSSCSHHQCTESYRHHVSEQSTIGTYFRDGESWGNRTAEVRPGGVPQSTVFGTGAHAWSGWVEQMGQDAEHM